MSAGDLISLLGYYMGILAIAIAYFSAQIDVWRNRVLQLESEWSPPEQKTNTQFKLRQQGEKKTLSATRPLFPVLAPVFIGVVLLILGYLAMQRANAEVSHNDVEIFLLVPTLVLLGMFSVYGIAVIVGNKRKLDDLK